MKVRAACCGKRKPEEQVHAISRSGGGNYRRPNRSYRTTICDECIDHIIDYYPPPPKGSGHLTHDRYSLPVLRRLIEARKETR